MAEASATLDQNCLIDLHLHLDGSVSVPMARRLAELDGRTLTEDDAALGKRLSVTADCRDLNEYLAKFDFTAELLETREQLSECMYLLQEELAQLGYLYAEIRFAPQRHGARGLTQREAVEAVLEGLSRSCFEAGVILCCMRGDDTREANLETVRLAAEYLGQGVVALDLAGAEALFPTADYADVFALARELGVPFPIIQKAMRMFHGAKRRLQLRAMCPENILVYDDYGHHPREMEATLNAVRTMYPDRRILLVFQPHRYTRTQALFDRFARVLSSVEQAVLLPIYAADEKPIPGVSSDLISAEVGKLGGQCHPVPNKVDAVEQVLSLVRPDDLILRGVSFL